MWYSRLKLRVDDLAKRNGILPTSHSYFKKMIEVLHLSENQQREPDDATVDQVYRFWRNSWDQDTRYLLEYTNYGERCHFLPENEARSGCMYIKFPRGVPFNRHLHAARQHRYGIMQYNVCELKKHLSRLRAQLRCILASGQRPAPGLVQAVRRGEELIGRDE